MTKQTAERIRGPPDFNSNEAKTTPHPGVSGLTVMQEQDRAAAQDVRRRRTELSSSLVIFILNDAMMQQWRRTRRTRAPKSEDQRSLNVEPVGEGNLVTGHDAIGKCSNRMSAQKEERLRQAALLAARDLSTRLRSCWDGRKIVQHTGGGEGHVNDCRYASTKARPPAVDETYLKNQKDDESEGTTITYGPGQCQLSIGIVRRRACSPSAYNSFPLTNWEPVGSRLVSSL